MWTLVLDKTRPEFHAFCFIYISYIIFTKYIKQLNSIFDSWLLASLRTRPFPFCLTSGHTDEKAWMLPSSALAGNSNHMCSGFVYVRILSLALATDHRNTPSEPPLLLSQAIFRPDRETTKPLREIFILWIIIVFVPSLYMCGIIVLSIQTKFVRPLWQMIKQKVTWFSVFFILLS